MTITNLAKRIKENLTTKDFTAVCFIAYFKLHLSKGMMLKRGISQNEIYKYINNEENSFNLKSVKNFEAHIRNELNELNNIYGFRFKSMVKSKWDNLGLSVVEEQLQTNKNGIQNIIEIIDKELQPLTIDSIFDLFEELNGSDRGLNDFFTPESISKFISKIVGTKKFGKNINIFDPTIGMGRLIYHSFMELKERYPNSNINIFGIDLNKRFVAISEALLNLVNNQNVFIEEGNTLKNDFGFPQMDICISNPPYEKGIEYTFVEYVKNLHCKSFLILPNAFTFHKNAEKIRKELMNRGLIKTIIQLPEKLFKNTNIQTIIVELDNDPLMKLEKLAIDNKLLFKKIDYSKDVKTQIKEFEEEVIKKECKENTKREINLLELRNKIANDLEKLSNSIKPILLDNEAS
ncbi:HsdM family class I SAM-dependent methyltransferase [Arcobacter ellisii]|uniref:site-specific DNA-methyltransferase (adenine-specific) n=1 Tax=Arcobacter ellisii TaxID=913109 RepID=A0A347U811_9BACT|nr:N-6 DNA methylase [Arcobacter ellisii]AXX94989.1 hypothetical protein AELL_1326 [Arcobacter ellisii]RXI30313.1 hypothetical protein CP962_08165 [Arcobacter ellisii]